MIVVIVMANVSFMFVLRTKDHPHCPLHHLFGSHNSNARKVLFVLASDNFANYSIIRLLAKHDRARDVFI